MKIYTLAVVVLVSLLFGAAVFENRSLTYNLNRKDSELTQARIELQDTKTLLKIARQKLGYLEQNKAVVQVTAYALSPAFGDNPVFANGRHARTAFAVPSVTLPDDKVINVALSPSAQVKLHAKMNDILVLMDKRGRRKLVVARFVDTTAPEENRPVVDVYFSNTSKAKMWGRHFEYVAINISTSNSPFLKN
jgi:hypothetical protein